MGRVRLIIVDDDGIIREKLRLLAEAAGADVLAEAEDGRRGIEEAERLHPELMLLDVSMPVMGGFPAARYLREHMPEIHIVIVSQHSERAYADEALQIGAKGYVVKSAAGSELGTAIDAVMDGRTFVSTRIAA